MDKLGTESLGNEYQEYVKIMNEMISLVENNHSKTDRDILFMKSNLWNGTRFDISFHIRNGKLVYIRRIEYEYNGKPYVSYESYNITRKHINRISNIYIRELIVKNKQFILKNLRTIIYQDNIGKEIIE